MSCPNPDYTLILNRICVCDAVTLKNSTMQCIKKMGQLLSSKTLNKWPKESLRKILENKVLNVNLFLFIRKKNRVTVYLTSVTVCMYQHSILNVYWSYIGLRRATTVQNRSPAITAQYTLVSFLYDLFQTC